jgi:hypothetical protein
VLQITRRVYYKLLAHSAINYSQSCYKLLADNFLYTHSYKLLALCKPLNISALYRKLMRFGALFLVIHRLNCYKLLAASLGLGKGGQGRASERADCYKLLALLSGLPEPLKEGDAA